MVRCSRVSWVRALGAFCLEHLGLLGDASQDLGEGGRRGGRLGSEKHREQGGRDKRHVSILMQEKASCCKIEGHLFIITCIGISVSFGDSGAFFDNSTCTPGRFSGILSKSPEFGI